MDPEEFAETLIDRANDGYHARDDYPPFAIDSMEDRRRWSAYIKKIAAEVYAESLRP